MPNIKPKINNHNRNIIQDCTPPTNLCNCVKKETFPMNGLCLTKNKIYEANIKCGTPNDGNKVYIGMCETIFKKRFKKTTRNY